MSNLKTTMTGYVSYRGREGHYTFLLHRITGLGTALFLIIHILDTSFVYFFPDLYQHAINIYRSTLFGIAEVGLVFCVFYHGVNGLRVAFFDLVAPRLWSVPKQRFSTKITLLITLLMWIPASAIMLYNMLYHNFGWFGG